jgi:hypothetical protein
MPSVPEVTVGTSIAVSFFIPGLGHTTVVTTFFPDHTTNYCAAHQQPKEYTMADKGKPEDAEDFAAINTPG